ncbi:hypothetical protein KXD40_008568 [Peronospora effusa]|uniref:Uncharacterized protein n=1 Tax=Peronospora effusa TaxID=542832 RepID=A0A3M6VKC8_9STRA|nr:hypothetical protein DD238_002289 [Peronospora effusa]UIZ24467.1 hypothetical protein KXD40_008568 [Peronospora effusa]CAI5729251.1 unnamed protein product [Peronospora effusa]
MELNAWRNAVSYGAHFQSIHLKVAGTDETHVSASLDQFSPSQTTQELHQTGLTTTNTHPNEAPIVSQLLEARTGSKTAQNEAESMQKTTGITVIHPFASECLNNGEQMALNVGGPVWAMDWLPSQTRVNQAPVDADSTQSKQKKARGVSAAGKSRATKALRCKENIKTETSQDADGEATADLNGSVDTEDGIKLEWKFLALATHPPCQVEEGKVVKSTPPDHYYDVPESGRNLIQIWAVPVQRPITAGEKQCKRGKTANRQLVKPRIVYAIDHNSGVAWNLQWCPLVKTFPKVCRREDCLGILAVCFGDGSLKVYEIPAILEERLQPKLVKETDYVVEKDILIVVGKLPRIMQLSVQWSPHNWNMLLTGASDGSVSLWNIETAVKESRSLKIRHAQPAPIEPQRRFQDADTIGKQEAFDWGCGWVAIRAVAWSPFDEHIFATTGNDSVFKVWDVREPRVCLRSHRIRSTWGLALQWMDQTSIQISGDQGSIFMYDILSGSYQKLHFHPQIDSPVWDLQFARRGAVPLLVSSCTSGSIRAAPAKKLYRAPQNCLEICRLSGEKDSSIDKSFKSLTVSFEKHSILGNADSGSQNTREFCERDAALHRLRLSSCTEGEYPCFLAAGGHAGLVILLELQEVLDTLITNFFLPPTKKIGRPKKIFATVGGHHVPKKGPSKQTGGRTKGMINAGRKARTLGSFAKAKGMHTALSKYRKKPPITDKGKAKAKPRAKSQRKSFIQEDGQVEVDNSGEEEEEAEFDEEDEEEESDLSLVMEDSSDDDRISVSDDDEEGEAKASTTNANPEEARLMKEYQLDLSEEDAYLLALQMSKAADASTASVPETGTDTPGSFPTPVVEEKLQQKGLSAKASATVKRKAKATKTKTKTIVRTKTKPTAKSETCKKRAGPTGTMPDTVAVPVVAEANRDTSIEANEKSEMQSKGSGEPEPSAPLVIASTLATVNKEHVATDAESSATVPKKIEMKSKQPNKALAKKAKSSRSKRESSMLLKAINKTTDVQVYQMGMSEEDALKEAIRLSESDGKRRSSRAKQPPSEPIGGALPTPTQPKQTPATPHTKGPFQMRQKKVEEPKEKAQTSDTGVVSVDEDAQRQWPQTPRRLQFSPHNSSESGDQAGVPPTNIDCENSAAKSAPHEVDAAASTAVAPEKEPSPKTPPGVKSSRMELAISSSSGMETSMKLEVKKQVKSTSAARVQKQLVTANAAARATPEGVKSAKRPKRTEVKAAGPAKKRKKTATTSRNGRRSSNGAAHGDIMSEEDAFLLALKMSEIEY